MAAMKTTTEMNSLGKAQTNVETATKELRAAQKSFENASDRLALAEEGHNLAISVLMAEFNVVKGNAKVIPSALK